MLGKELKAILLDAVEMVVDAAQDREDRLLDQISDLEDVIQRLESER